MNNQLFTYLVILLVTAPWCNFLVAGVGELSPITPKNGAVFNAVEIPVSWNEYAGAISYDIQVASDSIFSNIILSEVGVLVALDTLSLPNGADYYWNIRANINSGVTDWGQFGKFTLFDPLTIGAMQLWYAPESNKLVESADLVTSWDDLSGNSRHATQSNISERPSLVDSVSEINNFQVVNWDNHQLDFDIMELNDYTAFFMYNLPALTKPVHYLMGGDTSGISLNHNGLFAGGTHASVTGFGGVEFTNSILFQSSLEPLGWGISTFSHSGLYRNGITMATSTCGSCEFHFSRLGDRVHYQNNLTFIGDIAEVIVFSKELTTNERGRVEEYIYSKYAPPLNLGKDITIDYGFCDTTIYPEGYYQSYLWSDGSIGDSLMVNKSEIYWCEGTDIFGRVFRDSIQVSFPAYVTHSDSIICSGDTLEWYPLLNSLLYSYSWSDVSVDTFLLISDTGQYDVTISDINGCSTVSDVLIVQKDLFTADFTLGNDTILCTGNVIYPPPIYSDDISTYLWSDGTSDTLMVLSSTGDYSVTSTNGIGCVAIDTVLVTIIGNAPIIGFTSSIGCYGDTTEFISTSIAILPENMISWEWDFGDGNVGIGDTVKHLFSSSALYSVKLTVVTDALCGNSAQVPVVINPVPQIDFNPEKGCDNALLEFTYTGNSNDVEVTNFLWTFSDTLSNDTVSTDPKPTHFFEYSDYYNVQLKVISIDGCTDSLTKLVQIETAPSAIFSVEDECIGTESQFIDLSTSGTGIISYWNWDFGNGNTSEQQHPTNSYMGSGVFGVELSIIDINGCGDTIVQNANSIPLPVSGMKYVDICAGSSFLIQDSSIISSDEISSYNWSIAGEEFTDSVFNYLIEEVGMYEIRLITANSLSCTDTLVSQLEVHQLPIANFSYSPEIGESPIEITFTNLSVDNYLNNWTFGDGSTSVEIDPINSYSDNSDFTVRLIATSEYGCLDSLTTQLLIEEQVIDLAVSNVVISEEDGYIQFEVTIQNYGSVEISEFDFLIEIDGVSFIESRTDTISKLGTSLLILQTQISAPQMGSVSYVCVSVQSPNGSQDDNIVNDEMCTNLVSQLEMKDFYPNPVSDQLYINYVVPKGDNMNVEIYTVKGELVGQVYDGFIELGANQITYNVSQLAPSNYYIVTRYKDEIIVRILVKE
ncbi:MAG: hypothetical protein HRT72_10975 [Flavobacteriales bacterium]|nr:hypothetical protein [Flavobacteriales bacterium]